MFHMPQTPVMKPDVYSSDMSSSHLYWPSETCPRMNPMVVMAAVTRVAIIKNRKRQRTVRDELSHRLHPSSGPGLTRQVLSIRQEQNNSRNNCILSLQNGKQAKKSECYFASVKLLGNSKMSFCIYLPAYYIFLLLFTHLCFFKITGSHTSL